MWVGGWWLVVCLLFCDFRRRSPEHRKLLSALWQSSKKSWLTSASSPASMVAQEASSEACQEVVAGGCWRRTMVYVSTTNLQTLLLAMAPCRCSSNVTSSRQGCFGHTQVVRKPCVCGHALSEPGGDATALMVLRTPPRVGEGICSDGFKNSESRRRYLL